MSVQWQDDVLGNGARAALRRDHSKCTKVFRLGLGFVVQDLRERAITVFFNDRLVLKDFPEEVVSPEVCPDDDAGRYSLVPEHEKVLLPPRVLVGDLQHRYQKLTRIPVAVLLGPLSLAGEHMTNLWAYMCFIST